MVPLSPRPVPVYVPPSVRAAAAAAATAADAMLMDNVNDVVFKHRSFEEVFGRTRRAPELILAQNSAPFCVGGTVLFLPSKLTLAYKFAGENPSEEESKVGCCPQVGTCTCTRVLPATSCRRHTIANCAKRLLGSIAKSASDLSPGQAINISIKLTS